MLEQTRGSIATASNDAVDPIGIGREPCSFERWRLRSGWCVSSCGRRQDGFLNIADAELKHLAGIEKFDATPSARPEENHSQRLRRLPRENAYRVPLNPKLA